MKHNRCRTTKKRRKAKGVYSPTELIELGFGGRAHVYNQIRTGEIPSFKIGNKRIVPGAWVHERMGLPPA